MKCHRAGERKRPGVMVRARGGGVEKRGGGASLMMTPWYRIEVEVR